MEAFCVQEFFPRKVKEVTKYKLGQDAYIQRHILGREQDGGSHGHRLGSASRGTVCPGHPPPHHNAQAYSISYIFPIYILYISYSIENGAAILPSLSTGVPRRIPVLHPQCCHGSSAPNPFGGAEPLTLLLCCSGDVRVPPLSTPSILQLAMRVPHA